MDNRDRRDLKELLAGVLGCVGGLICALIPIALLLFLLFSNPTETDMRTRIAQDGWVPTGVERTNLLLFNYVRVNGFSGAKGSYIGIGSGIFKLPWSD